MDPTPAVEVRALRRVYEARRRARGARRARGGSRGAGGAGDVVALDGVSLRIAQGEVHGLLGPNGAGKTTLVKILATVLLPTAGTAEVLGSDVVAEAAAVRRLVGIVFGGEQGLYTRLTARQILRYWAALYRLPPGLGRRRAELLLERVGLSGRADDRVETYSRGMKQRLHLARGLIGDPRVLFLDEPTNGMDPVAARDVRALVAELRAEGRTILLATHDMVEAESVCDRVTLIDRGRIMATESPRTLAGWISRYERIDVEGAGEAVLARIRSMDGVRRVVTGPDGSTRIEVNAGDVARAVLCRLAETPVRSLRTSPPSLEEVYLELMGDRGLRL